MIIFIVLLSKSLKIFFLSLYSVLLVKILILIFSYIFCQLPNSYHIDNLDENSRDLINGWPSKSILDITANPSHTTKLTNKV